MAAEQTETQKKWKKETLLRSQETCQFADSPAKAMGDEIQI